MEVRPLPLQALWICGFNTGRAGVTRSLMLIMAVALVTAANTGIGFTTRGESWMLRTARMLPDSSSRTRKQIQLVSPLPAVVLAGTQHSVRLFSEHSSKLVRATMV